MKKNKAERGDMECLHTEGDGEIINNLGRKGFTEKVVSGHRPENIEIGPGSGNNTPSL